MATGSDSEYGASARAQNSEYVEGHKYAAASPHIRHQAVRGELEGRITEVIR
jgi:hypothetical protein